MDPVLTRRLGPETDSLSVSMKLFASAGVPLNGAHVGQKAMVMGSQSETLFPGGNVRESLFESSVESPLRNFDDFERHPELLECTKNFCRSSDLNCFQVHSSDPQLKGLVFKIYPKFEFDGDIFVWQANTYVDGHQFLSSLRKFCLNRYSKDTDCLLVLTSNARCILNVYQGYYRSNDKKVNLCKIKFLRFFVSRFKYNVRAFDKSVNNNTLFVPHVGFAQAYMESRSCETLTAQAISIATNWDFTSDYVTESISEGAMSQFKGMAADYVDRFSILTNIVHCSNTLYDVLVSAYKGQCGVHDVVMAINTFYRSLDFTNPWAVRFKKSLVSLFPVFEVGSKVDKVKEIFRFLIKGCSSALRKCFDFFLPEDEDSERVDDVFVTKHVGSDDPYDDPDSPLVEEEKGWLARWFGDGPFASFIPHGPMQGLIDITQSDLGIMTSKLSALVASFCALLTVDGPPPEFSMSGLIEFSKKVAPIVGGTIIAGTFTNYLIDLDRVLAMMWQCADSIFKGDFGRFIGVDSYSQIFELYTFVVSNYGGVAPHHHSLSYNERDCFVSPVTLRLPASIINSSDPHWRIMINELEGRSEVGGSTAPKAWSEGLQTVAHYLNMKLEDIVKKASVTKELKTKFSNITTHLHTLSRSACREPSPVKASGHSFIFTGGAGIGKSTQIGAAFKDYVIDLIMNKAYKYGYDDIGDWRPGQQIDGRLTTTARASNFQLCRQGGVNFLFTHAEDFDPVINPNGPPKVDNLHERIMSCCDTISANRDAAALTTVRGDGVKGDNRDRIIAGFYSENRSDAGLQDLAVNFPAAVRRTMFIEWKLDQGYADSAGKLNVHDRVVKGAKNSSGSSQIYNRVSVYTFERMAHASGEWVAGEEVQRTQVTYTFVEDQSFGVGSAKVSFKKGHDLVLTNLTINAFYCYITDFVNAKYEESFSQWRQAVTKSRLKAQMGRCLCDNGITLSQCCKCAGPHEFNPYTGNLAVLCPVLRDRPGELLVHDKYAKFEERSVLCGMHKINDKVLDLFKVMVHSPTLRPVTRTVFRELDFSSLLNAHVTGEKWAFAERTGAFIEPASLDHLLKISAGSVRQSPASLESWWQEQFDPGFSLSHAYFLLLRYLVFTPSVADLERIAADTPGPEDSNNVTIRMLHMSGYACGVDCNGVPLISRIASQARTMKPPEAFAPQATLLSLIKLWIFYALLDWPSKDEPLSGNNVPPVQCDDLIKKYFSSDCAVSNAGELLEMSKAQASAPNSASDMFHYYPFRRDRYITDFVAALTWSKINVSPIKNCKDLVSSPGSNYKCEDFIRPISQYFAIPVAVINTDVTTFVPAAGGENGAEEKADEPFIVESEEFRKERARGDVFLWENLRLRTGHVWQTASGFVPDNQPNFDNNRLVTSHNGCCVGVCLIRANGHKTTYHDHSCRLCRQVNATRVCLDVRRAFEDARYRTRGLVWPHHLDTSLTCGEAALYQAVYRAPWESLIDTYDGSQLEKLHYGVWKNLPGDSDLPFPEERPDKLALPNVRATWHGTCYSNRVREHYRTSGESHYSEESYRRLIRHDNQVVDCPEWADPDVWWRHSGQVRPMYLLASVDEWKWSFNKFLTKLREQARASRFKDINPFLKKAILTGLAGAIGGGALYLICKTVLNKGEKNPGDFEPHGVASDIPAGKAYWDDNDLKTLNTAASIHNQSNVTIGSHGRTPKALIQSLAGMNPSDTMSRICKVKWKNAACQAMDMYAILVDSSTFVLPAHAFAQIDLSQGLDLIMSVHTTNNKTKVGAWVDHSIKISDKTVAFSEVSDLCRVYHALGVFSLKPLDCYYKSPPSSPVQVKASYFRKYIADGKWDVVENVTFINDHKDLRLHGEEATCFPHNRCVKSHLQGAPVMECLARLSAPGQYERKCGECGLPCVLSANNKHPTIGFYIGKITPSSSDGVTREYETYVTLTESFMRESYAQLHSISFSGRGTSSTSLGSFSASFVGHMNVVCEGFDEPGHEAKLMESVKRSRSNIRYGRGTVDFRDYMPGKEDCENVARDTEMFKYSGSKSGIYASLPTFEEKKVMGIYPSHSGVRGIYPIIGSDNDVFFYPELLHLGVAPWADEKPHETFGGDLIFGMVGPGEETSDGSKTSMGLGKEVAKCMIHAYIPPPLIKDASSRLLSHYIDVTSAILNDKNFSHDHMIKLLHATVDEQFTGVVDKDGEVIMPKMDHTSSWGSNNKPMTGSNKRDVYEITEDRELIILDGAEAAWEAFTAALYCLTCGVLPENQVITCFTKRECYPVTGPSEKFTYSSHPDALSFYSSVIGPDKARALLACKPFEDQKIRNIFHSVDGLKVKVKSRLVSNLPGSINVGFRMLFLPVSYLLMRFPIEFDMVAGLDMGSCHFEQSTNEIFHDGYDKETGQHFVFDADVNAWDKIMPAALTRHTLTVLVELVFAIHKFYGTFNERLVMFSEALMRWWDEMSLFYGSVVLPVSVMPSGFVMTLPMNSAMNQLLAICNVLRYAEKHGLAFPDDYTTWIRHKALGDDSQTAIKPAFVAACRRAKIPVFSAVEFSQIMLEFGITSTLGDKSDGADMRYQEPSKLVFLQHVMYYIRIPAFTIKEIEEDPKRRNMKVLVAAAPLKAPVLVKMLAKQDSSSVVDPRFLLRDQVYILLGELVPYGRMRFDKFVAAVRRFRHDYWKPPEMDFEYETHFDWNFWLDRYVQKFCRDGKLDSAILKQRQLNQDSFEALKSALNPHGIYELDYEGIT